MTPANMTGAHRAEGTCSTRARDCMRDASQPSPQPLTTRLVNQHSSSAEDSRSFRTSSRAGFRATISQAQYAPAFHQPCCHLPSECNQDAWRKLYGRKEVRIIDNERRSCSQSAVASASLGMPPALAGKTRLGRSSAAILARNASRSSAQA